MSTAYFPKLTAHNYQRFRALMNDEIPDTFPQWDQRLANEKDEYLLKWHPNGVCADIEIDPSEFARFCQTEGTNYTLEALKRFASKKAGY